MLKPVLQAVAEFHKHKNVAMTGRLDDPDSAPPSYYVEAINILNRLKTVSKLALNEYTLHGKNPRDLRFHLETEECSERLNALLQGDEIGYLDGFADSLFVMAGTAVVFDLPVSEAFEEVCRSNMSKRPKQLDTDSDRLLNKGADYSPPDLARVLAKHRLKA